MGIYKLVRSVQWWFRGYPASTFGRILKESSRWSRPQLEAYRNDKLRRLIAHCYDNVPYYRRVMDEEGIRPASIERAEDLDQFPILTKEAIRNASKEFLATNISEMRVSWSRTGGTTGEPMRICKDSASVAWSAMCYERGLEWGGLQAHEPRIRLFGGSLGIDRTHWRTRLSAAFRKDLFLPAFELSSDTARSYFERIRRSRSRVLIGYASAIYRLAVLADELGEDLELAAVFPTAELMLPEWERQIREVFDCPVLPYYGCGEVNSLGYTAPDARAYLIPEEHALIETLWSGKGELRGDGPFLITDLDNYAMPLIRYRNGDAGRIAGPSGRWPYCRIERLDGRYNSFLMTETGELVSGVIGAHIFRHVAASVTNYQIIQEEPLFIRIKIVARNGFSTEDEHLVERLFRNHVGRTTKIVIEKVEALPVPPSGKSVFVINRCLEDSTTSARGGIVTR